MRSYGQYCPMAMALEVLGDRWTLLIVRDLLGGGCRFNDLARGLPGISRTLLARRLRQLERAGILERRDSDERRATVYVLTRAGQALLPVIESLVVWGAHWAFDEPGPAHLDPVLLLWSMRGGVRHDRLPARRVVVQFDFQGAPADTMWLVLEPTDASVCLTPPGFEVDVVVTADLAALYRVWLGRLSLAAARRAGLVRVEGTSALVRGFPTWWTWSPTAPYVRAATRTIALAQGNG